MRGRKRFFGGVSLAPTTSGDTVLPRLQDKDGQKQCVAHNAFRGRGAFAIARCCTWPSAECRINAGSAAGAGCSQQDQLLTGNAWHSGQQRLQPAPRNCGSWG